MKKSSVMKGLLVALVGLAGCTAGSKKAATVSLEGEWNIIKVNNQMTPAAEETPFLGFNLTEKRLYGSTGCNNVMGDVNVVAEKNEISFSHTGSTRRMCQDMKAEEAILSALGEVNRFSTVSDTEVQLESKDGKPLLLLQKAPQK